jgi:hypothetical protein
LSVMNKHFGWKIICILMAVTWFAVCVHVNPFLLILELPLEFLFKSKSSLMYSLRSLWRSWRRTWKKSVGVIVSILPPFSR